MDEKEKAEVYLRVFPSFREKIAKVAYKRSTTAAQILQDVFNGTLSIEQFNALLVK